MSKRLYKKHLLGVLAAILAFNNVDRFTLGLVLPDIKRDLHLSDTELGLVTGIAFALFYSLMGIPIARWADRGNRVTIISITTALWSVGVVLCATAGSFLQLMFIRMGVAVGEAGCVPPAHSLIADYFSRAERPKAVSIYMLGASVSILLGYFGGGWFNQFYGWRSTFLLLGLPGFLLAPVAWATLKEPRRATRANRLGGAVAATGPVTAVALTPLPVGAVCLTLFRNTTFRHLLVFFSILQFFGSGVLQWQPSFLVRTYGLRSGELGTWLAIIYGFGGTLGLYIGGEWAARRALHDERLQMKAMGIVYGAFAFATAFVYLTDNRYVAFTLLGASAIAAATVSGPLFATIQTLVPERMRAMSIAIIYLFSNLIGLGLGPLAAGILSDRLHSTMGDDSLRYALLALCPGYLWAGWHLWCASRTIMQDFATVGE
jgi:MFS family permease